MASCLSWRFLTEQSPVSDQRNLDYSSWQWSWNGTAVLRLLRRVAGEADGMGLVEEAPSCLALRLVSDQSVALNAEREESWWKYSYFYILHLSWPSFKNI